MEEQIELIRIDLKQLSNYRQDDFHYAGCTNDILLHLKSAEIQHQKLQKELSIANDKLKRIEEYTKLDLKEAEDYMAKYKGTNRELYENWKFAYETDKNILQFIYEIKGDK